MTRSNDFSISYGSYMILSTLDCICCCLTKFCDSRNWYKRKMLRYKRLELAKQKLQGELSIFQYLTMKRQSLFLFKTWLNRRQRTSVKFFKRYTVQNSEIDKDWDNEKLNAFDVDRVVSECDFKNDLIDRRIAFEMTGLRLNEDDWPE